MKKLRMEKDPNIAERLLKEAYSELDKTTQRRIFHPNKAARHKSQLAKTVGLLKEKETQKTNET